MSVQSNTYTTIIRMLKINIFLMSLFVPFAGIVHAQEVKVKSLSHSKLHTFQYDVFLDASAGRARHGNLWTANNSASTAYKSKSVYATFFSVGGSVECYSNKIRHLFMSGSVGYTNEFYGYTKQLSANNGVYASWIYGDLNLGYGYFGAGIKSDFFVHSKMKNLDNFSFEGLNNKCFNKVSFCCYASIFIRFTKIKLEARIGSYIKPHLDPQKISYYNLSKTHLDGLYFQGKVIFRIFTTGNVHKGALEIDN